MQFSFSSRRERDWVKDRFVIRSKRNSLANNGDHKQLTKPKMSKFRNGCRMIMKWMNEEKNWTNRIHHHHHSPFTICLLTNIFQAKQRKSLGLWINESMFCCCLFCSFLCSFFHFFFLFIFISIDLYRQGVPLLCVIIIDSNMIIGFKR